MRAAVPKEPHLVSLLRTSGRLTLTVRNTARLLNAAEPRSASAWAWAWVSAPKPWWPSHPAMLAGSHACCHRCSCEAGSSADRDLSKVHST